MAKRRILFCGEASYLSTGFSVYSHEVIKRLYDTGKFEIAELGSYAKDGDQRAIDVPWKFYPVEPSPDNKEALAAYNGKNTNQFGEWRFTDVLLDFRPDIVWDHRDWWMSEFQGRHPLRNNYHWCLQPTVDGEPQREKWLDTYKQADSVFCYSQYGYDVLAKQSRGKINLCEIASPCADVNVFKPVEDKREHKNKMGFDPDSFIIGMVARNQKRKLYGDLIEMYASLLSKLKRSGKRDLAAKTYLYLHTTYPDSGFDIGKFVRDNKVGSRVLMTYFCNKCNTTFPTTFKGEVTFCPNCNQYGAFAPHANAHCSREALASIYNLFDIYVQYTICFHPNTPVLTNYGWKDIKNVVLGDMIIGNDGQLHKIYKTMSNQSNNCYDIEVKCRPWTVTTTHNHPFLKSINNNIESVQKAPLELEYISSENIKEGDLLAQKISNKEIFPTDDLPFLDKEMAYYLGLFAADGHANISNGSCRITLAENDNDNINNIRNVASKMNKTICKRHYDDRKAIDIDINNTDFCKQLRKLLYDQEKIKKLPDTVHLWPIGLQKALVDGLMSGDGCQDKPFLNIFCTTSKNIATTLDIILPRLNMYYNLHIQERDSRLPMYRFEIRTDGKRSSHETLYKEGYVLLKVRSIRKSQYTGEVINIDVEDDHNYTIPIATVHNCEGFGMPALEAKACGVPVMAVDYSAMEDHANSPGGMPIRVERFFHECMIETEQMRALPDNDDCANKLMTHIKKGKDHLKIIGQKGRDYVMEVVDDGYNLPRFSWDRTAAIWEKHFETCPIPDREKTWDFPEAKLIHSNGNIPDGLDNAEFVKWCCINVYRRPDLVNTCEMHDLVKNLNCGFRQEGNGCPHCHRETRIRIGRQEIVNYFTNLVNQYNQTETRRVQIVQPLETNCEVL